MKIEITRHKSLRSNTIEYSCTKTSFFGKKTYLSVLFKRWVCWETICCFSSLEDIARLLNKTELREFKKAVVLSELINDQIIPKPKGF